MDDQGDRRLIRLKKCIDGTCKVVMKKPKTGNLLKALQIRAEDIKRRHLSIEESKLGRR